MQNGMNFLAIETVLKGNFVDNFMQWKLRHSTETFHKVKERFSVTCPSNDTIKSCLISFYKANSRRLYQNYSPITDALKGAKCISNLLNNTLTKVAPLFQ